MLNMGEPKLKPPPHLRGRDLDLWYKEQNQIRQKLRKKQKQKESSKCVSLSNIQNKKKL